MLPLRQGGALCIKLGDTTVEYSEDFKFYMTTKMRHTMHQSCTKVRATVLSPPQFMSASRRTTHF